MKYWGPIRCADLKNRTDDELAESYSACTKAAQRGFLKMGGGLVSIVAAVTIAPLVPFLPFLLVLAAPVLLYTGFKDCRQNIDGMKAHKQEEDRRAQLGGALWQPTSSAPVPAPSAAPVFNGEAAVVLGADITTMKRIKITARAEQPQIS